MFTQEALFYGIREGIKLGLVYMVWSGLTLQGLRGEKFRPLLAGLIPPFLLFLGISLFDTGMQGRDFANNLAGYVFFIFFFIASIVLFRFPESEPDWDKGPWPLWVHAAVFLASSLFFAPDAIASAIYLGNLARLGHNTWPVYTSLALGAVPVFILAYFLSIRWSGRIRDFFGLAQFLIFLVLVKLLLSGATGFTEFSLVPTVQRGVMKFVHDLVHQSFVFLLVPDHPMLKISTWNFIGFFFGPDFSIALALSLLLVPPLFYLYCRLSASVEYPDSVETGADRRLVRSEARRRRARRMIPIAAFVLIVVMSWYSSGSEQAMSLYVPEPKPLIEDKGMVIIPLTSPGSNIMDGRIHKFSILIDGRGVRLLLVRKPDGALAVTLDACEICPPDGYGQRDSYAVCIYCMTPIPIDTLGRPGGCNPIPLDASISERDVRIQVDDIRTKWNLLVNSRKGGEK